jgi:hypothetical protein
MEQLSNISEKIVELVGKSQGKSLLGVRLGAALKATFPAFVPAQYQCKNLRQFIKKHVPAVAEIEYSGVDVLYGLTNPDDVRPAETRVAGIENNSPVISLPIDIIAWKAYSNPSYPFSVAANPTTGEIKAIGQRDAIQPPWISIPKVSSDTHRKIASEFVNNLQDPSRSVLQNVLAGDQWYVSFFGTTKRLELSRQWGLYKREHLIRLFTEALHSHGIVAAAPAAPKHDLRVARNFSKRATDPKRNGRDDDQLRELVSRLALALPIDELRALRLPIGLVLDAVNH